MKLKKLVATMLLSVSASLLLAGCGSSTDKEVKNEAGQNSNDTAETNSSEDTSKDSATGSSEKIKISFLNGFTGGDGGYMRKITDGFNESQDKYEIVESQEKDHYLKFKSGDYDLVVIHGDRLKTYVDDEMIQDAGSIYEKAEISLEDFAKAGQDIVSVNDGVYAFPLDIHPLVMFYNKELVKEAPKTYEDIVVLNNELKQKGDNVYAMGVPGLGLVEFYYMSLANQSGVEILDGDSLNFATDEFADILLQFNKMIFEDKVSPSKLGLDGEFKTFVQDEEGGSGSQTAIALTGPWYYSAAKEKYGDNLGIAAVPVMGKEEGTYGNAHTIAVSASVEGEEKEAGIAEFLKYMYSPEVLINWADAGQAPLHKATMDYIEENKDAYPLAYINQQQFENCKIAPQVYNVGEQTKYINENVFNMVVSTEGLTKEALMKELEKATQMAKQISEGL